MKLNLVITESCNLNCSYCVSGDTQISMVDNTTKTIKDIIVGDKIVSIDDNENYTTKHKYIKVKEGTVTKLFEPRYVEKLYHIITENNDELYITGEHPVMSARRQWKSIDKIIKSKEQILYDFHFPIYNNHNFIYTEQYMIGYMLACWLGDGSFRTYKKSSKYIADTYAIRFVVKDDNIMKFFKKCLDYFEYDYVEYPFKISTKYNIITNAFIDRKKITYDKIINSIELNLNINTDENYYRGFLAGIYDCEGCLNNKDVKICNGNIEIIKQIETALKYFDLEYNIRIGKQYVNIPVSTIRLYNGSRNKFLETVYPQCEYKRIYWYQTSLNNRVKIKSIKEIDFNDYVYNIETDTHTYIANNILVHNCYMNNNPINMDTNVIDKTIENIPKLLSIFNKRKCDIVYFGGEPLINLDLIKYTHNKIKDLPFINNELIISNLLLLDDDIINYIKTNNINVSWSFDGLWNKTNRLMKDGTESFDLYMDKLDTIKRLTQGCKVMISPSCVNTMVDNLKFFVEELNIYSPDFSLVRDNIWSETDILLFETEIKILSEQVMNYLRNNINISVGLFTLPILDMIVGKKLGKRPFGCFVGNSGIAIMPNGDIYPCARFGTNKINSYGNILNEIDYEQFININDKVYLDPRKFDKCKQCKLYNYCNAGCTFSQIENNNEPLNSICKLYHIIYKESINIYNIMLKENNKLYKEMIKSAINNIG